MFYASPPLAVLMVLLASITVSDAARAEDRVVDAARVALQARTAGLPGEWQFTSENPPPAMAEDADVQIRVGQIEGRWPRSRVGVPVQTQSGEGPVRSHLVWFSVHRWQDVSVYTVDAHAGDSLGKLRMQLQRRDMAHFGDAAPLPPVLAEPGALRLKRSVRAGQPALRDDFETAPAVAGQKDVALTVIKGLVRLRTRALSQKDAAVGELVNVLPNGARQWVQARVTAPGEVNLEN